MLAVVLAGLVAGLLTAGGLRPESVGARTAPVVAEPAASPSRAGTPDPTGRAATGGTGTRRAAGSSPSTSLTLPARGAVVRAADVLRAWDGRRAEVWADMDVAGLRDLYVDRAGVADVRLLRRYVDRGYRVEGLTTQLLAVDVLERAPGRWRLRVTDRVTSAVAVRGSDRVRLPRDRADTHIVTLLRANGMWRVAAIRPDPGR